MNFKMIRFCSHRNYLSIKNVSKVDLLFEGSIVSMIAEMGELRLLAIPSQKSMVWLLTLGPSYAPLNHNKLK